MLIKKQTIHRFLQLTIERLVKSPISWAKEMKIMRELWDKNPSKTLWTSIDVKLPSLAWFFLPDGKDHIQKTLRAINFEQVKPPEVILQKEKCGDDIKIKKIMTIRDFLRK